MPTVELMHHKVPGSLLRRVTDALPSMVAAALTCKDTPGFQLVPEHVAITTKECTGAFDALHKNILVVVEASEIPERRSNLDDRQEAIRNSLREEMRAYFHGPQDHSRRQELSVGVWLRLLPSSFGEFTV